MGKILMRYFITVSMTYALCAFVHPFLGMAFMFWANSLPIEEKRP